MVSKAMQEALNNQVKLEAASSQAYLAMASWSEIQPGLDGVAEGDGAGKVCVYGD